MRIDADEAESSARAALTDGGVDALAAALDLFTGEILPEDRYARWADDRRSRLALLREQLLLRLGREHLDRGPRPTRSPSPSRSSRPAPPRNWPTAS